MVRVKIKFEVGVMSRGRVRGVLRVKVRVWVKENAWIRARV